jgi:hypothetical protein
MNIYTGLRQIRVQVIVIERIYVGSIRALGGLETSLLT